MMIFDAASAIVAHSFVNNNGRGPVELPAFVFRSTIDIEQLSKVSNALLESHRFPLHNVMHAY
jgi:hypothetical protein